jgi:hypothetical protein
MPHSLHERNGGRRRFSLHKTMDLKKNENKKKDEKSEEC